MFCWVNVWQIVELNVNSEIKFGEWIYFGLKDTTDLFGRLKFGEARKIRQICPTLPLPYIPAIQYNCSLILPDSCTPTLTNGM